MLTSDGRVLYDHPEGIPASIKRKAEQMLRCLHPEICPLERSLRHQIEQQLPKNGEFSLNTAYPVILTHNNVTILGWVHVKRISTNGKPSVLHFQKIRRALFDGEPCYLVEGFVISQRNVLRETGNWEMLTVNEGKNLLDTHRTEWESRNGPYTPGREQEGV
jgi:hypothetical protein